MTRTKLHTLLQLVNGFVKARKHNGMPCNFRKGSGTKGKGKMHKGLGFQPERGEQRKFGGYCNWCWRIGHKEAQCLLKQEYIKSNPSQDPLQRDTRELSNTSEKRAWSQPAQGQKQRERQRQEKTSRKGNHNQDQAGSLNEYGQRKFGYCGFLTSKSWICRWCPREWWIWVTVWIQQLMCFAFLSATVFQWIRQNCRVRRRESLMGMESQRALMKNSISQR